MTSIFRDYGYWDGKCLPYAPAPNFSVGQNDFAGRAAFEFKRAAEDASIAIGRMETRAADAVRWQAEDEKLEELKRIAADCEQAIARVIEQLAMRAAARAEAVYDAADHANDVARDARLMGAA